MILMFSILVFLYFFVNGLEFLLKKIPKLENLSLPSHYQNFPKISIVIPAKNEENDIEKSIRSLLTIDYPNLELIVVNDRSTDKTGQILEMLAQQNPVLRIVHNTDLPEDWMGKQFAMNLGAKNASGEWLLFTDADIFYHPQALKKAIYYATNHQLDHLTLQPKFNCINKLFGIIMMTLTTGFSLQSKPWRVNNPASKKSIGIGAFNLVKKSVYDAIGGHSLLKMNADDDLKLGQIIREKGYQQGIASALSYLSVNWYSSVQQMVIGLEKNSFAFCNYNFFIGSFFIILMGMLYFFPIFGLFSANKIVVVINAMTIFLTFLLQIQSCRKLQYSIFFAVLYPIGVFFNMYMLFHSMWKIGVSGQVGWRGTQYPLALVKTQHLKTKF